MKLNILILFVFSSSITFSQSRVIIGNLESSVPSKHDGGLVIAEPSKRWSILTESELPRFSIECMDSDTALTFLLYNHHFRHRISSVYSSYIVDVNSESLSEETSIDKKESDFQIILREEFMPLGQKYYYFINNDGIRLRPYSEFISVDTVTPIYYRTDNLFNQELNIKIKNIVKKIQPNDYNNNNVDDGEEIRISILYEKNLYEYTIHYVKIEQIDSLIEFINSKLSNEDKIECLW